MILSIMSQMVHTHTHSHMKATLCVISNQYSVLRLLLPRVSNLQTGRNNVITAATPANRPRSPASLLGHIGPKPHSLRPRWLSKCWYVEFSVGGQISYESPAWWTQYTVWRYKALLLFSCNKNKTSCTVVNSVRCVDFLYLRLIVELVLMVLKSPLLKKPNFIKQNSSCWKQLL